MHPIYTWLAQRGFTGRIGKEVILKKCGKKILVAKYPCTKNKQATTSQKQHQQLFRQAVEHAKKVCADPQAKRQYEKECKPGQTVFNVAIKNYLLSVQNK